MTANYGVPVEIWWVISISACLGGSFSIAGAAANMVGVGLIEKHSKESLKYGDFLRFSMPVTIMTLVAGTAYILLRFSL